MIFAADPGTGITYIFVAGDYNWEQYLRGDYVWSEWHEPEGNEPDDPNYDNVKHELYVPEAEPATDASTESDDNEESESESESECDESEQSE